jgi:UDP-N-acetylenolpyruvoylglucosamine reductase
VKLEKKNKKDLLERKKNYKMEFKRKKNEKKKVWLSGSTFKPPYLIPYLTRV